MAKFKEKNTQKWEVSVEKYITLHYNTLYDFKYFLDAKQSKQP